MSQAEELVHVLFNKASVICYAVHADRPGAGRWLGWASVTRSNSIATSMKKRRTHAHAGSIATVLAGAVTRTSTAARAGPRDTGATWPA